MLWNKTVVGGNSVNGHLKIISCHQKTGQRGERNCLQMIPCVSLTETSVLGSMKERVKEMRVFGCRLNFWNTVAPKLAATKGIIFVAIDMNYDERSRRVAM